MPETTPIFGVLVSAEQYQGNTLRLRYVDATSEFSTLSADKLMLGGFPVSLYENANGKHALGVHVVSSGSSILDFDSLEYGAAFSYKGSRLYYKTAGQYNVWAFDAASGSSDVEYDVPWHGHTLSLNSNRDLLCHIESGTPDETQIASIGGIPMPFVRFGNAWHLAIVDDSGVFPLPSPPPPAPPPL